MDKFSFIVKSIDPFLNLPDSANMMLVCKSINGDIHNPQFKAKSQIKNTIQTFHNMLSSERVRALKIQGSVFKAEIPSLVRIIVYEPCYNNITLDVLTDCTHNDHNSNIGGNSGPCYICATILRVYNSHMNGTNIYRSMDRFNSFVTSVCMHLYH